MEFHFNIQDLFPGNHPVCLIDSCLKVVNCEGLVNTPQVQARLKGSKQKDIHKNQLLSSKWKDLFEVINCMGESSAKAQGLLTTITTGEKLLSSQHHLYILKEQENQMNACIVGILKVGPKRLFVVDEAGTLHERMAFCVLDFYVKEEKQRKGHGKKLFDTMLQVEDISAGSLAIDRPSPKLIAFLQKHYGLKRTIPQANNFVVFSSFFPHNKNEDAVPLLPRHRHSYCAGESDDTNTQCGKLERASRPHSLGGIAGFSWSANGSHESLNSIQRERQPRSLTKDASSSASSRTSFGVSPKHSSHLQKQSSSWNVFGIPPPDYLE